VTVYSAILKRLSHVYHRVILSPWQQPPKLGNSVVQLVLQRHLAADAPCNTRKSPRVSNALSLSISVGSAQLAS